VGFRGCNNGCNVEIELIEKEVVWVLNINSKWR